MAVNLQQSRINKAKAFIVGFVASILAFLLFGVPTALIRTSWFNRMTPSTNADYVFLVINSVLLGSYIGLHFYRRFEQSKKGDWLAASGAFANVFAIGCPICGTLLVSVFGAAALLTYFDPYRPVLGMLSTIVLVLAIYVAWKTRCARCSSGRGESHSVKKL